MSQPEPGPSRRRRHTPRACNNCRRRRCKCDGVQPICSTCSVSGHECSWSADTDETRPPTKQYVESLRVKVHMLETEITQLKHANSKDNGSSMSSNAAPTALSLGLSPVSTPTKANISYALPQLHDDTVEHDRERTLSQYSPARGPEESVAARSSSSYIAKPISAMKYQYMFNIDTSIPVEQQSPEAQASLTCEWDRHLPDLGAIQLSRTEHDTIISRFFSYGTSWLCGLIPSLFLGDMVDCLRPETSQTQTQHYSPMLHCSLLALAAAFSDNHDINTRTTRNLFAAHAKQWIDQAFRRPTPTLILSLALLSEHHCGLGEMQVGYMYMGMSVRAARIPISSIYVVPDWYQWTTFVQDKLMALENNIHSEALVPRAPMSPPVAMELGGRPRLSNPASKMFEDENYAKSVTECFIQSCKLMTIATRMSDVNKSHKHSKLIHVGLQLVSWFNALPGVLLPQDSPVTLPHVLSLHICYWWLILDLNLPLLDHLEPTEPVLEIEPPIKMCDRATDNLIQLIDAFETQHGLCFFPRNQLKAIYTCGRALLAGCALASAGGAETWAVPQGVDACISSLRTIASTWPCAKQLADDLEACAGSP